MGLLRYISNKIDIKREVKKLQFKIDSYSYHLDNLEELLIYVKKVICKKYTEEEVISMIEETINEIDSLDRKIGELEKRK